MIPEYMMTINKVMISVATASMVVAPITPIIEPELQEQADMRQEILLEEQNKQDQERLELEKTNEYMPTGIFMPDFDVTGSTPLVGPVADKTAQLRQEMEYEKTFRDSLKKDSVSSGSIELKEDRTINSKTYLNSDGSKTQVSSQGPIHFKVSDSWEDIDENLNKKDEILGVSGSRGYINRKNEFDVEIPEDLSNDKIKISKDNMFLSLRWSNILSNSRDNFQSLQKDKLALAPHYMVNNKIKYKDIYPDTDLIYYSTYNGLKEDIVINKYNGQNIFEFELDSEGLDYEQLADGSFNFYKTGSKDLEFMIPVMYMWDNKGGETSAENAYSYNLDAKIVKNDARKLLRITASDEWLSSPERVFPITIDPSMERRPGGGGGEDAYVESNYPNTNTWNQRALYIGHTGWNYKGITRTQIEFNPDDLTNARILNARFEVVQYSNCTGVCTTSNVNIFPTQQKSPYEVTWNNQPNVVFEVMGADKKNTTWDWFTADVTNIARYWYNYGNPQSTRFGSLYFIGEGEDQYGYRTWVASNHPDYYDLRAKLIVNYNDYNAYYYPDEIPEMTAGDVVDIPIRAYNDGRNSWYGDQFFMSYHWVDNSHGGTIIFDPGVRGQLSRFVTPKTEGISVVPVRVPPKSGNYTLKWDLVHENVTWFSQQGVPTGDRQVKVTAPSFSSMNHLGSEEYYAKAGPVDLATGNLSYSSTDMSVSSITGGVNITRSYNSNVLDEKIIHAEGGYIKQWLINGPYLEPEQSMRLSRDYIRTERKVKPSTGSTSNQNLWTRTTGSGDERIDFLHEFSSNGAAERGFTNNNAAYAHVYVYSNSERQVQLRLGSDDGIAVWLNTVMVHSNDIYRSTTLDNDIVDVALLQGWNSLLVKVSQGEGGWEFATRFTDNSGNPLSNVTYALDNPEVFDTPSSLGYGWTSNLESKLYLKDPENIYFKDGTGTVNIFTKNSDGSYNKPAGTELNLSKNSVGRFELTGKDGTTATYLSSGLLKDVRDLSGNFVAFGYEKGRCVKVRDENRYLGFTYSDDGMLSSVENELGYKMTYQYQQLGRGNYVLSEVIDTMGAKYSYNYDVYGKLIQFSDKAGNSTKVNYSNKKVSSIVDAVGNTTSFNYNHRLSEIVDPLGNRSSMKFNNVNLLVESTNAKSYTEKFIYDGRYNLVSTTPVIPENSDYYYKYRYEYDGNNNLIKEIDPMDSEASYQYSGNDLIRVTDPEGNVSENTYTTDGRRLLLSSKDPKGNLVRYSYDDKGRVQTVTDSKGAVTTYAYTTESDLGYTLSPKGDKTSYKYDKLGRRVTEVSPQGKITRFSYNKRSQLIIIKDASGLMVRFTYDINGNKIKMINPDGSSKRYQYDILGQVTKTFDEADVSTSFFYDANGNQTKIVDAKSNEVKFEYDQLGQLTKTIDEDSKVTTISYDPNGNVDRIIDPTGNATTIKSDKLGQTVETNSPKNNVKMQYSKLGQLVNVTSSIGSESNNAEYDKNGNVVRLLSSVLGENKITYNQLNQQTQVDSSTNSVKFGYDENGNLEQINNTLSYDNQDLGTNKIVNDSEGKVTREEKANGDVTIYEHDLSGRITSITNKNSIGQILSKYNYEYDLRSNITKITDQNNQIENFGYDVRNQLIDDNGITYKYDVMGNRIERNDNGKITRYSYYNDGKSNKLHLVTYPDEKTVEYKYDDRGNTIEMIKFKKWSTKYEYNDDDYFTKATRPNGDTVEYIYDSITNRRAKRISNISGVQTITKFIYDGDMLVSETDDAGNPLITYTWDLEENLISVTMPDNNAVMQTYYYIKNAKGDVVGLSNKDGNQVASYSYDTWGVLQDSDKIIEAEVSQLVDKNPRLYGSYWYDKDLEQYFMKTRMYDPNIGRFLSKDSEGGGEFALDQNPYIYCNNNPVDRVDPDGKSWFSKLKEVASGVVKAVENAFMKVCTYVESAIGYVADKVGPTLAKIPGMKWGAEKVGQYSDKYGGSMGSALVGGALVALTITDIAAGAGLVGLAGKTLAKTIFTKGASQALLKKSTITSANFAKNGISTAKPIRSQAIRSEFLKSIIDKSPKYMNQWLKKGKVSPGYEVHHNIPLYKGGKDIVSNMRLVDMGLHKVKTRLWRIIK